MVKEMKERKMFVGVVWNCAAELKLFLTALLFLCTLATILQFLPSRLSLFPSDLRLCLSTISSSPPPLPPPSHRLDQILQGGAFVKRAFNPFGSAAYSFIQMGAYRGGLNTFAVIGLASKPLQVYAKPTYQCEWVSSTTTAAAAANQSSTKSAVIAQQILPDWGYGRVYTVVVLNCTFSDPVGVGTVDGSGSGSGGKLILRTFSNGGGDRDLNSTVEMEALREEKGSVNASIYTTSPPKYDYLYCGSSLYGNLSPQRVREWIAYHAKLFGERSHFVIHDAGGVHEGVLEVLKPWMERGYVTLQDVREQERFDGYYHNQFLVVNDCLHRYRFMAKWMFFFDVDEFIYVPPKSTIKSVLDSLSEYTQFTIEQMPMSNRLCLTADAGKTYRKWGMEKLVYRDVKRGIRRDRKYAVQPRNVIATGVHMSQNVVGKTTHKVEGRIKYFHYHGTVANRREPCRQLVNATEVNFQDTPYVLDTTLRDAAPSIKRFEFKTIGTVLQRTPQ